MKVIRATKIKQVLTTEGSSRHSTACLSESFDGEHALLARELRVLSGYALAESDAAEAARTLAGFVTLLAQIDAEISEQGNDDESNRSGHSLRETEERTSRVRKHRPG